MLAGYQTKQDEDISAGNPHFYETFDDLLKKKYQGKIKTQLLIVNET